MKGFIKFWNVVFILFWGVWTYSLFFGDWIGFSSQDLLPWFLLTVGIVVLGLLDSIQKIDSIVLEKNLSQSSLKRGPDGIEIVENDGPYVEYYPNGVLKCEGKYLCSVRFGDWKEYTENGDLKETVSYLFGKKWGESKKYFNNGQSVESLNYYSGRINKRTYIQNGEKIIQEYFENGELRINIIDKNDLDTDSDGNFIQNHITGELHLKSIGDFKWEYYDLKGQIYKKLRWKDEKLDGLFEEYYENGKVSNSIRFKEGKKEGLAETYFSNGNLGSKCFYKEGEVDGIYESFCDNGNISSIMNYKNGVLDGVSEHYYENGILMFKTNYKNGKQEGIHERFNEKGKLVSITTYKNDVEVSKKNQLSIWVLNRIKF